jgi:glycerol-3-phosphate O-acyltransferase
LAEEKVRFIPVAVVYDQIPDVADMAAQEAGAAKTAESLMWFTRYLRSLGGSFGDIHLRFGKPMSLHDTPAAPDLSQSPDSPAHQLEIQKLAFEACFRINEISPATPISLVLLSVLCHGRRSFKQIDQDVLELAAYVSAQHPAALELKPSREIDNDTGRRIKALLSAAVLESPEGWPQDEVRIRPQAISMAIYYSNMAVHHFVESAFTELALAMLVLQEGEFSQQRFEIESLALRELFKYEFFFSRKDEFQRHMQREFRALGLESAGLYQRETVLECLRDKQIRVAVGVLSPYLAAYRRVVLQFASYPASSDWTDEVLLTKLLSTDAPGTDASSNDALWDEDCSVDQPMAARVSGLPETGVSRALLANGLLVAGNYRLRSTQHDADAKEKRRAFMAQLDRIETALELLAAMNQVRRDAGVIA